MRYHQRSSSFPLDNIFHRRIIQSRAFQTPWKSPYLKPFIFQLTKTLSHTPINTSLSFDKFKLNLTTSPRKERKNVPRMLILGPNFLGKYLSQFFPFRNHPGCLSVKTWAHKNRQFYSRLSGNFPRDCFQKVSVVALSDSLGYFLYAFVPMSLYFWQFFK